MTANSALIKYISLLSNILKVQPGKISFNKDSLPVRINDNKTTTGFLNIVLDILKQSNTPLAGKSAEDRAEIRQWIEYVVVYAANANSSNNVLKELDAILLTRTYLVSDVLTIADLVLYCALQGIVAKLSYLEKEKYINICRWFDNIQCLDSVRETSKPVDFKTVYLVAVAPSRH